MRVAHNSSQTSRSAAFRAIVEGTGLIETANDSATGSARCRSAASFRSSFVIGGTYTISGRSTCAAESWSSGMVVLSAINSRSSLARPGTYWFSPRSMCDIRSLSWTRSLRNDSKISSFPRRLWCGFGWVPTSVSARFFTASRLSLEKSRRSFGIVPDILISEGTWSGLSVENATCLPTRTLHCGSVQDA